MTGLHELKGFEEKIGKRRPTGEAFYARLRRANWKDQRVASAGVYRPRARGADRGRRPGRALSRSHARAGSAWTPWSSTGSNGSATAGASATTRSRCTTTPSFNHLPYMPFPPSWPTYLPKDMVADWFEAYAWAMEINFWTGTELVGGTYDESAGRWNAVVRHADGTERTLHPRHLVFANGLVGFPHVPDLPGLKDFKGEVMHTTEFTNGADWRGKKALVIGHGNERPRRRAGSARQRVRDHHRPARLDHGAVHRSLGKADLRHLQRRPARRRRSAA